MNFEIREISVKAVTARKAKKERRKFSGDARENFKRAAAQMLGLRKGVFFNYQIHHIIPLGLGGTSNPENIVLILEETHEKIHKCIDKQIPILKPGEEATIRLPFPKFPMVWDPEKVVGTAVVSGKAALMAQREKWNPLGQDWLMPLRRELSIYPQVARAKVKYGVLVL